MLNLTGVLLLSTTGWFISQCFPRSAARRHVVLCATLYSCLLLPAVFGLRSATTWTWMTLPVFSELQTGNHTQHSLKQSSSHRRALPNSSTEDFASTASVSAQSALSPSSDSEPDSRPQPSDSTEAAGQLSTNDNPEISHQTARRLIASAHWRDAVYRWGISLYATVSALLLLRIVVGLTKVWRLKRRAIVVDTFNEGILVAESRVGAPLAVGFGRPMIVLPLGFHGSVGVVELRDVLEHEAEHLHRRDHWTILLQGVFAAAYWPIVTVHLVNRALNRAREELCDNAVLSGRDPASYGQSLLVVAERVLKEREFASQLAPSVIGDGELELRVAGLLDDKRDRRTHVARPVRWFVATGLVSLAALTVTTRIVAVAEEHQQTSSNAPASAEPALTKPAEIQWSGIPKVDLENPAVHRGIVLGPDGQPLAGASIYAASSIELLELLSGDKVSAKSLGNVRGVSDAKGRFEFKADDLTWVDSAGVRKRWETLLVATKDGVAPGWLATFGDDRSFRSHWNPHPSKEVAVRTHQAATLSGRLLLKESGPMKGARIRLIGLMAPFEYDLNRHIERFESKDRNLVSTIDYAEELYRPWLLPGLTSETSSNDDGQFEIAGLPEGYIARVEITHPQAVTTNLRSAIRGMESIFHRQFQGGQPELALYGSGFTAELEQGTVLRGRVVAAGWGTKENAVGVTVATANQNEPTGMSGQRFVSDAEGKFEVTGLRPCPEGDELAFAGSFAAPWSGRREKVFPGKEARIELTPAVRYRLKLTDSQGNPVDRNVYSVAVQQVPGSSYTDAKALFNVPEQVAPGIYQGIVPARPAAVMVKRHRSDRSAVVDPKAFFAPGRTDWTLEEERFAYGDAWRIAGVAVSVTDRLAYYVNPTYEQLEFGAILLTNARTEEGPLELSATIHSDPPVEFHLIDEAGEPVEKAKISRQLKQYDADGLPTTFSVFGLHPERAEFLMFRHVERGFIATLTTTWQREPVKVVMRPAATLRGRFVDKAGKLNFDFGARIQSTGVMPDTYVAGQMYNTSEKPGERSGEFELIVPPEVELRAEFVRKVFHWETRPTVGTAFGPLTLKAGEVVNLGDIVVP